MMRILSCCLMITALVLISCSSSDGGGVDANLLQSGTYQITEQGVGCDDSWTESYPASVSISGSNVTLNIAGQTHFGTITNGALSFPLPDPWFDDGGTVTPTAFSVTATSATSFSGSMNWGWSDGEDSCSGTTTFTGTRSST